MTEGVKSKGQVKAVLNTTPLRFVLLTPAGEGSTSLTGTYTVRNEESNDKLRVTQLQRDPVKPITDMAGNELSLAIPSGASNMFNAKEIYSDGVAPTMSVLGSNSVTVEAGNTYVDAGATATDLGDGGAVKVTSSGSVDTSKPGSYQITYTATDKAGNTAIASRSVTVKDTTPPAITINEGKLVFYYNIEAKDNGATAIDLVDGTVSVTASGAVNADGSVDTSKVGSFIITYTATDKAGNTATADKHIRVVYDQYPQTSHAGADPYVYPILSDIPVKLPNNEACYRLYQDSKTFINAEVREATPEHKKRMREYVRTFGLEEAALIDDGFFFSKFFIMTDSNKMLIDLKTKQCILIGDTKKDAFAIKEARKNVNCDMVSGMADQIKISWTTKEEKFFEATVSFYDNPNTENGISLFVSDISKNALGLCVNNYKPKLMCIPTVFTENYNKVAKRVKKSDKPFQNKRIVPKNEYVVYSGQVGNNKQMN